jgi:hypothetical protein
MSSGSVATFRDGNVSAILLRHRQGIRACGAQWPKVNLLAGRPMARISLAAWGGTARCQASVRKWGNRAIKGPSGRLKHDVRRVWECRVCGRRDRTGGQVVNRVCPCPHDLDPPRVVWMRLVEDGITVKEMPKAPEAPGDATP